MVNYDKILLMSLGGDETRYPTKVLFHLKQITKSG